MFSVLLQSWNGFGGLKNVTESLTFNSIVPLFLFLSICFFYTLCIPTNNVAPFSAYELAHYPLFLQSLWRRANDRNISLETLHGGQFTLSTQLITWITLLYSPTDATPHFLQKLTPLIHLSQNSCLFALSWQHPCKYVFFHLKLFYFCLESSRHCYFACRNNPWVYTVI